MDGETMKLVTGELRKLAEKDLKKRGALLNSEVEALNAVRFLLHCKVKHVYVTVEKISTDDGRTEAVPILKVVLHYKNPHGGAPGRRTLLWKKDPLLEQVLNSMEWDRSWSKPLSDSLLRESPGLRGRLRELEQEIEKHARILQGDEAAVAEVRAAVKRVYDEERAQREAELRERFKVLVRSGWKEEDVLRVWREEQVRAVQDS